METGRQMTDDRGQKKEDRRKGLRTEGPSSINLPPSAFSLQPNQPELDNHE
jgi:hypothetical protein